MEPGSSDQAGTQSAIAARLGKNKLKMRMPVSPDAAKRTRKYIQAPYAFRQSRIQPEFRW